MSMIIARIAHEEVPGNWYASAVQTAEMSVCRLSHTTHDIAVLELETTIVYIAINRDAMAGEVEHCIYFRHNMQFVNVYEMFMQLPQEARRSSDYRVSYVSENEAEKLCRNSLRVMLQFSFPLFVRPILANVLFDVISEWRCRNNNRIMTS